MPKQLKKKHTVYDKPVSLYPLSFPEALDALLKTKPMPKTINTKNKVKKPA